MRVRQAVEEQLMTEIAGLEAKLAQEGRLSPTAVHLCELTTAELLGDRPACSPALVSCYVHVWVCGCVGVWVLCVRVLCLCEW